MSETVSLVQLLSVLIDASLAAGDLIRTVLKTMDLHIQMKGENDPMTIVI